MEAILLLLSLLKLDLIPEMSEHFLDGLMREALGFRHELTERRLGNPGRLGDAVPGFAR